MDRRTLLIQATALATTLATGARALARESVIGAPCEGCDWVFDDQPADLGSRARIAPAAEPGVPMTLEGVVKTMQGRVAADVIVYAYHTDRGGLYPPARNRHGRLRGWAITDARGHYRFDSIRPAAYPGRSVPEHVHMHVIEPGRGTYYIDEVRFLDDPLITAANRRTDERAGSGLVMPTRRAEGWSVRRDIVLGLHIPGYPGT